MITLNIIQTPNKNDVGLIIVKVTGYDGIIIPPQKFTSPIAAIQYANDHYYMGHTVTTEWYEYTGQSPIVWESSKESRESHHSAAISRKTHS